MNLSTIAFRNINRNRRRSILSGAAITAAVALIVFLFSIITGMKRDMEENITKYTSGHIRIRNPEFTKNEKLYPLQFNIPNYTEVLNTVKGMDQVLTASPRIQFATLIYEEGKNFAGLGNGVDFELEEFYGDLQKKVIGTIPANGQKEILLSQGLAEEIFAYKLGEEGKAADIIGEKIELFTRTMYNGANAITFKVTGIVYFDVAMFNKSYFLIPLDMAQKLLKLDSNNSVIEILVLLKQGTDLENKTAAVAERLKEGGFTGLEVQSWKEANPLYSFLDFAEAMYNFIAILFFVIATTVIVNTTMMVIYERMREIGTVAAMGMTGGQIVRLFFLEALFISMVAALVGVVLGIGITVPLSREVLPEIGLDFGEALEGMDMAIPSIFYPVLNVNSTVFVYFYAIIVAAAASFLPSRRAAKIEPVEALRAI